MILLILKFLSFFLKTLNGFFLKLNFKKIIEFLKFNLAGDLFFFGTLIVLILNFIMNTLLVICFLKNINSRYNYF